MRARQALLCALFARSTITQTTSACYMCTVGQNHIYSVCMVFIAGKFPCIRYYTVYMYSSGQPHTWPTGEVVCS